MHPFCGSPFGAKAVICPSCKLSRECSLVVAAAPAKEPAAEAAAEATPLDVDHKNFVSTSCVRELQCKYITSENTITLYSSWHALLFYFLYSFSALHLQRVTGSRRAPSLFKPRASFIRGSAAASYRWQLLLDLDNNDVPI